jgi:hypothetical protein
MFKFTFNAIKDECTSTKMTIDGNPLIFQFCRNMLSDLYDINIEECRTIEDITSQLDDDIPIHFSLTSTNTPIHPNTYSFIKDLCKYLIDNNITPDNFENRFEHTDTFIENLVDKYSIIDDSNITKELGSNYLLISVLNTINFLNCDNNFHIEGSQNGYVLNIICKYCASPEVIKILQMNNTYNYSLEE